MSSLRKSIGQRIKAARRAAGYKSARAFATAIGVSESSIANAEIGSDRVGMGVYMDIETGLDWPTNSIRQALETENLEDLQPRPKQTGPDLYARELRDEFEEQIWSLKAQPEETRWAFIFDRRQRNAAQPGSGPRLGQTGT